MITIASSKAVLVAVLLALPIVAGAQGATLETQTNREGAVTVQVTPKNLSPGAQTWDFAITLDTHTVSLDQDMTRAGVLVVGSAEPQPALTWEGDPPSGHHRKGVLRFQTSSGSPEFVELRISGIGGVEQRVFRWRLGR